MGLLFESKVAIDPDYMRKKRAIEKKLSRKISAQEFERDYLESGGGR